MRTLFFYTFLPTTITCLEKYFSHSFSVAIVLVNFKEKKYLKIFVQNKNPNCFLKQPLDDKLLRQHHCSRASILAPESCFQFVKIWFKSVHLQLRAEISVNSKAVCKFIIFPSP